MERRLDIKNIAFGYAQEALEILKPICDEQTVDSPKRLHTVVIIFELENRIRTLKKRTRKDLNGYKGYGFATCK